MTDAIVFDAAVYQVETKCRSRLSRRQFQIVCCLVLDLNPKEIALLLGITADTVNHHIIKARDKLGVRTTPGLVARAIDVESQPARYEDYGARAFTYA